MRTSALALTGEESQEAPRNSHGDWTFLRQHEWVPEVPVITQKEPHACCRNSRQTRIFSPQCEMRLFSAAASGQKSHLPSGASKASLTPLRQLKKFHDIPVSTREEHRGSRHNSRRAPVFPPHLEMRVHFLASSRKESRCSHRTSRGDGLNFKLERNSRGNATIPKDPDVPIHSRYTWFPCTDSTVIEHQLKTRWHV